MRLTDKSREAFAALWQRAQALPAARKASFAAAGLGLIAFGAAGVAPMAPDASDLPVTQIVEELALPDLSAQIAQLRAGDTFIAEDRVRAGDSLAALLDRMGVHDPAATAFIRSDAAARALLNLRPGKRLQVTVGSDGRLLSATALIQDGQDSAHNLVIERDEQGFTSKQTPASFERRIEMRTAEIRSSLFAATDAVQIPDAVAMQIVDIFSADIDFASDLRKGDRFQVVYETLWQGGEQVRTGRVLAAEFRNDGKTRQAIWYAPIGHDGGYYDRDGKSLKKAFLKSPLQFSRVTSGFAMRVHPISGQWKQHKGIDFAAPVGTPIRATGDGVIDFSGAQGGYGNLVVVRHGPVYSTAYAHMSRIAPGMQRGAKVSQGDVIGFVGTSGWSTGPHLHYEFRVNNDARDPNSIVVAQTHTLTTTDLPKFREVAADMSHRFTLMAPDAVQLAAR